jgi:hypothetical protein
MKVYLPLSLIQQLSKDAQYELMYNIKYHNAYVTQSMGLGEKFIHVIPDEVYNKIIPIISPIIETMEDNVDMEKELNHLREVKKSVDAMKELFK